MNRLNEEWYAQPEAVAAFAGDDLLEPTLVLLLIKYSSSIVDRDVLDLGVGPGRTTAYLSKLTSGYIGIDYSQAMVDACSRRFPASRIELGDKYPAVFQAFKRFRLDHEMKRRQPF